MMKKINLLFLILAAGVLFGISVVSADFYGGESSFFSGSTNNWQYYQPTFNTLYSGQFTDYWPILSQIQDGQCQATTDFIIGIPPGGCTPLVVRSDLLAEQNVPVFCQLYAVKVNPLIKVSSIRSISFRGDYPDGVAGISYYPARAAVKSYTTLLGDPLINNIGYVVIILKQEKVEDNIEDWIAGNLTATIYYDADKAYGTGRGEYYLPVTSDEQWAKDYEKYSFWNGKGFLRVTAIDRDSAKIEVLSDRDNVVNEYTLKEGETSYVSYLPGYYCKAGLSIRLDNIDVPEDMALLNVDGSDIWVRDGTRFLDGTCSVTDLNVDESSSGEGSMEIYCSGNNRINFEIKKKDNQGEPLKENSDPRIDSDFNAGRSSVEYLIDNYRSEMKDGGIGYWGEEALYEQINLAEKAGKLKSMVDLIDLFARVYPDSSSLRSLEEKKNAVGTFDIPSVQLVHTNGVFHSIGLVKFNNTKERDNTVKLRVDGLIHPDIKEGQNISLAGAKERLLVEKIYPNKVRIKYINDADNADIKKDTETIYWGESEVVGNVDVEVDDINADQVAAVSLNPRIDDTKTDANFTFRIGVEKRGIELSPEKTKEMIGNINDTIKRFEDINDKLGGVIEGWKGTCFATSSLLMLKSAFSGASGEGLARQKVMAEYRKICDADPQYGVENRDKCYNDKEDAINSDVEKMTKALQTVNSKMDSALDGNVNSGGLFDESTVVDPEKYKVELKKALGDWSTTVNGQEIKAEDLQTTSQIRAALLDKELSGGNANSAISKAARTELEANLMNLVLFKKSKAAGDLAAERIKSSWGVDGLTSNDVSVFLDQNTRTFLWSGKTAKTFGLTGEGISENTRVQAVELSDGKNYLVTLGSPDGEGRAPASEVYERAGSGWSKVATRPNDLNKMSFYASGAQAGECTNPWPAERARVIYYESGTNKGLPAIVPFDLAQGWYVMVPNSGGSLLEGTPQGYTASADVSYFRICNVGTNQLMENGLGDDLCQTFSVNSAASVDRFLPCPTMKSDEVAKLYSKAREAIRQASYQRGQKEVSIFGTTIQVGNPMSEVGGFECQDFMSPSDCKLLFNVCDPVICPPSRCDLGGKMPVSDVIQTGIIGSIALCLPNAAEGIYVPICLSGIHAGVDAYTSILESERDCLQRSLETGETIGICDEITSIYKCEFFWKQLSPLTDLIAPRLLGGFTGSNEGVRGGGEYLLIQNSFSNLEKSIDYFKDTYATNAFRAFSLRSTDEVGSAFCKAFIGTSVPSSGDLLDELLAPESPYQFYAYFSENLFTEATVPATSQYKVYYHIYAGNDQGVQYQVYLKNPPASSYYQTIPRILVDSGYIGRGESADQSKDFTAPAGYKELCVVVNAREECGFRQVTTDFGLDYLQKKYVEDQANTVDITSEKECISGSPSAYALASPNLQSGVQEAITPDITLRGITRICATNNPGAPVGNNTRWKDVGYCGDPLLRCWLDLESVRDDLEDVAAIEGTLSGAENNLSLLEETRMSYETVAGELSTLRGEISQLNGGEVDSSSEKIIDIISRLDAIAGIGDSLGQGTNAQKAEALALKATVYRILVNSRLEFGVEINPGARAESSGSASDESPPTTESTPSGSDSVEVKEWATQLSKPGLKSEQLYIYYGGVRTDYYIREGPSGFLVMKSRAIVSDEVVGSIDDSGIIEIQSAYEDDEISLVVVLKDLENQIYSDGSFSNRV